MKVKALKNRLSELLQEELGTYLYPNGEERPSIAVIPPQLHKSINLAERKVECILYAKPKIETIELFGGYHEEECYQVYLGQNDLNKTLENCQRLINAIFGGVSFQERKQREVAERIVSEELIISIPGHFDFENNGLIATINNIRQQFYN